jgi:heme-degrading monooxygenase HmoA
MDVEELQAFHTHLTPHPADHVLHSKSSPVTEIFLAYFPKDYSVANQQGFAESLESFLTKITPEASAMTGFSGGWSLEERPIPGSADSGKTYITCIGWTSVEAHEAFTKTQVFKDSQHLIHQADQLIQTEVVHYTGIRFK